MTAAVLEPVPGVRMWVEQDNSIHLHAVEKSGDPIELGEHEAEKVIAALHLLLERLRGPAAE